MCGLSEMKAPILEGILHPITKTVLFHQRISHIFLREGGKISILPFLIHLSEKKKKNQTLPKLRHTSYPYSFPERQNEFWENEPTKKPAQVTNLRQIVCSTI